jgi:hypothetical protein
MRRNLAIPLLLLLLVPFSHALGQSDRPVLVEARKIWDRAPHNAFTDLLRSRDRWYCVFREGQAHVSSDGTIRVISSPDGATWSPVALLTRPQADLRDPKIVATPDGRLMIVAAAARDRKPNGDAKHQSIVWFSPDGQTWDEGHDAADPDFWLWRLAWRGGEAHGVAYGTTASNEYVRLYRSRDGLKYEPLVDNLFSAESPSEAGLAFLDDGTLLCLLRRDKGSRTGMLGTARPPYTAWTWRDLGVPIGGPQMIRLPDGRLVAGVRLHDKKVRTSLGWVDPREATFREFLSLPSGGDTSYPGLVWHGGLLWVSYYASHEGRTSIYLAKAKLPER